jgi:hypothetical protein
MTEVVLDAELRQKLNGGASGTRLLDETGKVLGVFVSVDEYVALYAGYAAFKTEDEDIEKARREMLAGGGVTTAEMLDKFARMRRAMEQLS